MKKNLIAFALGLISISFVFSSCRGFENISLNLKNVLQNTGTKPRCDDGGCEIAGDGNTNNQPSGCDDGTCTPEDGNNTGNSGGNPTNPTSEVSTAYSSNVIDFSQESDFNKYITSTSGWTIVEYYRGYCTNCIYAGWAFEILAKERNDIKFYTCQTYGTAVTKDEEDWDEEYEGCYNYFIKDKSVDNENSIWYQFDKYLKDFLGIHSAYRNYYCHSIIQETEKDTSLPRHGSFGATPTIILYKNAKPVALIGACDDDGYCWMVGDIRDILDIYIK